jgi:hypothetical protein
MNLLAAQRAGLDVIAAGQVFQVVEPHLLFHYVLLQDFDTGVGSGGEILAS